MHLRSSVEPELAYERLVSLYEQGLELLDVDPGKDSDGRFYTHEDTIRSVSLLKKRTNEWVNACRVAFGELFVAPPLASDDIRASGAVYPRLDKLRTLIAEVRTGLANKATETQEIKNHDLDDLHPQIAKRSKELLLAGVLDVAVFNAFKTLEDAIRTKANAPADAVGVTLVKVAMNPMNPILTFSCVPAEQEAFHSLYRGALGAFKNPHSHRFVNIDIREAVDLLRFATLLMRLLERSTLTNP